MSKLESNNKPVIALMYDFDKTLCTKDMQEYTFIPRVNKAGEELGVDIEHYIISSGLREIIEGWKSGVCLN